VDTERLRGTLIVGFGVFVLSFDAVLVRLAQVDGWTVGFWRGGFMALALGLFLALRSEGAHALLRAGGWMMMLAAFMSGFGSLLFVLSVMHTRVANTVVILSAAPLFAALFTRFFLDEGVRLRTWIAIVTALGGVVIVFYGSLGEGGLIGDLIALVAAVSIGANLTLLRRYPQVPRMLMVCIGGLVTALLSLPFAEPLNLSAWSLGVLAVMGLVQMPIALVLVTVGTRYLPAPEVSLFLLLEAVLGPLWVWLAVGEVPPVATFGGGILIIVTLAVHSWLGLRRMP
jgi:drug/metabolite transporter (DMT)-like permease